MNIMLVQPYENYEYSYDYLHEQVKKIIESQSVDLIVFPEAFMYLEKDDTRWDEAYGLSLYYEKPIMLGFSTELGTEEMYYVNATPLQGDTENKVYIKHSTAERVLFDFDISEDITKLIYEPIILHGKRIQAYICHDMYFPLITERLEQEGLDVLINLTGGNVKMSKWCNILKGRSIELQKPVLCTMANRVNMNQQSDRIAYHNGQRLQPTFTQGNGKKEHAFSIFSLTNSKYLEEVAPYYSEKLYDQFTVGTNNQADCCINLHNFEVTSQLDDIADYKYSMRLQKNKVPVHVHVADAECLRDRLYIFNEPRQRGDHEIYIYVSEEDLDIEETIALLKLRAIENRVAVVVFAPNLLIGAKTNRYKDIQLFKARNGMIGFDLAHMYGVDSVYQKDPKKTNGLLLHHKEKYEALIK